MKSQRLTKDMRQRVTNDILSHAFTKHCEKQVAAENVFAQEVYDDAFADVLTYLKELPSKLFFHNNNFRAQFGGEHQALYFGAGFAGGYGEIGSLTTTETVSRPIPYSCHYAVAKVYGQKDKFVTQYERLMEARRALDKEIQETRVQTESILARCSTSSKLLDTWPEIESFVKKHLVTKDEPKLPAAPVRILNARLDLPPETSTAA